MDPTTGNIILCQLADFEEALGDGDDLVFVDRFYALEDAEVENDNNSTSKTVDFYFSPKHNNLDDNITGLFLGRSISQIG